MMNWFKKIPAFMLFVLISICYLLVGFLVGYFVGYQNGQSDYFNYLNNLSK